MKIRRKPLLIFIILVIILWITARLTGMYQVYNIPTVSMEPTLPVNRKILASNLKDAKRNDIIIFTQPITEMGEIDTSGKRKTFCSRLIAIGGDKLEIKNGYAYVNDQLGDDTTKLKFPYSLDTKNLSDLLTLLEIDESGYRMGGDFFPLTNESRAYLSYSEYEKAKNLILLTRVSMKEGNPAPTIYNGKNWTIDNFGPYVVPPNFLFVMGDNRHNAMDSRYIGPIPVKDCKGVLIMKF